MAVAGMVADKHKVDSKKAEAMGMLAPSSGLAALASVLQEAQAGQLTSSIRGAAGSVYWKKLLGNVKPVPPMFADVIAAPEEGSQLPTKQQALPEVSAVCRSSKPCQTCMHKVCYVESNRCSPHHEFDIKPVTKSGPWLHISLAL